MHRWGDSDVDWVGIDDAAEFIDSRLRFWRVDVRQSKEKFGTVRVYCSLGIQWWPQLTHPGHAYNRWPKWLNLVVYAGRWSPFRGLLRLLNKVVVPFHVWLYRDTYQKAVLRWPHLYEEITCAADYKELLRGLKRDR